MKTPYAALLAVLLATVAPVRAAGEAVADASPPNVAADDGHRRLAEFVGLWTVRQWLSLESGKPPQIDVGTAVFTMFGGRHLQQDLRVGSRPPFQALGTVAYDPRTNAYFTTWIDLNLTNVLTMRGRYDAADATYRFSGDTTFDDGQTVPTREELHRVDADHFVVRYFETRGGSESLVVELAYSRR
ncbi:DUF1579 family protein [Cognatilysobacter terrigena]|uniref:DUF1579 family protein n=1 Tax=Cognatilysobacter terrigena TaxID=2488749 RepID=UPI001415289E|nr:DUF1579 family protein [Lysobacter terrigena]